MLHRLFGGTAGGSALSAITTAAVAIQTSAAGDDARNLVILTIVLVVIAVIAAVGWVFTRPSAPGGLNIHAQRDTTSAPNQHGGITAHTINVMMAPPVAKEQHSPDATNSSMLQVRVACNGATAINFDNTHPNPLWRGHTFVSTGDLRVTNLTDQKMNLTPSLLLERGLRIDPLRTERDVSAMFRAMADTPPFFGPILTLEPFETKDGYFAFLPDTDWYNQGVSDLKNHWVVLTDQLTNRRALMPWGGSYEPT